MHTVQYQDFITRDAFGRAADYKEKAFTIYLAGCPPVFICSLGRREES